MALKLVTAPAENPVTLAEAKEFLRVDGSHEDVLIEALVKAATQMAEKETGRVFVTQTWDLWLDRWPSQRKTDQDGWWDGMREGPLTDLYQICRHIEIPRAPLQSVASVKTYATDNTEDTFSSDNYFADNQSEPGRVSLAYGKLWPTIVLRPSNGIQIQFVAGYGGAAAVPEAIKTAIKLILMHLYENRGCSDTAGTMPSTASAILSPYVIWRL